MRTIVTFHSSTKHFWANHWPYILLLWPQISQAHQARHHKKYHIWVVQISKLNCFILKICSLVQYKTIKRIWVNEQKENTWITKEKKSQLLKMNNLAILFRRLPNKTPIIDSFSSNISSPPFSMIKSAKGAKPQFS